MSFPNSRVVVTFPALPCTRSFINSVAAREMGENSERTEEKERAEGGRQSEKEKGGESEVELRPYNFVVDALLLHIYRNMNSSSMPRLNFGESSMRTRVCAPVRFV